MTDYHAEGVKLLAYVPRELSSHNVSTDFVSQHQRIIPRYAVSQARFSRSDACVTRQNERTVGQTSHGRCVRRTDQPKHPCYPCNSLETQPGPGDFYQDVSPILTLPGGGTFFIGNVRAAANLEILKANNISHVINTQDVTTTNYFENDQGAGITYLRFPIAHWWNPQNGLDMNDARNVRNFYAPLFDFAERHLKDGKNVMVHCLAGAHRAGTAGISVAMYFMKINASQAVGYVKERRPIVDPIGSFPDLLKRLESALREKRG